MSAGEAENQLPRYLLKHGNKKGDFSIKYIIKEANKILDYDSNIDANEIEYPHSMSAIAKEMKEKFKEEEQ
eukprot:8704274-Ditylum_brightwellii.AAC.2